MGPAMSAMRALFLVLGVAAVGADVHLNVSHVQTQKRVGQTHELRGVAGAMAKRLASAEAAGESAAETVKTEAKGLPWTTTVEPQADVKALNALNLGGNASSNASSTLGKADQSIASGKGPEVIAKFTASAQASAKRAQEHLQAAKAALEKTTHNAESIHSTGKKIEKTANTIGYLYSTPKPSTVVTTQAPAPKSGAIQNSVMLALAFCLLGSQIQ